MPHDPAYYREKAARCRRMAQTAFDPWLEGDLLRLAAEFEAEAVKAEAAPVTAVADAARGGRQ